MGREVELCLFDSRTKDAIPVTQQRIRKSDWSSDEYVMKLEANANIFAIWRREPEDFRGIS